MSSPGNRAIDTMLDASAKPPTEAVTVPEPTLLERIEGVVESTTRTAGLASTPQAAANFLALGFAAIDDLIRSARGAR